MRTDQQRLRVGGNRDQLAYEGGSFFIGRPYSAPGSGTTVTSIVPKREGLVQLVDKVCIWTQGDTVTSPVTNNLTQLLLVDSGGTTRETLSFLVPNHALGAAALQANNDRPLVWVPKQPIMVPEGWRMDVVGTSDQTTNVMCFGHRMNPNDARAMGVNCSAESGDQTTRRWIQTGTAFSGASPITLVSGRTGMFIEITDIVFRMQATTFPASVELRESDDTVIFRWVQAADTGEPVECVIQPRIFTRTSGNGLKIVYTNCQNRASMVVSGRFVDAVPGDAWYSFAVPPIPTPGNLGVINAVFPGITDPTASTVKAAPGKGYNYVVEGFAFSAAKDATFPSTPTFAILSYGTGVTAAAAVTIAGGQNVALTPAFGLKSHDQHTNVYVDNVHMPCGENLAILFETQATSTPAADGDISNWGVTVWGRTQVALRSSTDTANYAGG